MRAVNVFLIFIFMTIATNSYSEEINPYFLKPSDPHGNALTEHFRNRTTKIHDEIPCMDRIFYPHLATPAHALPGNRFAYEPFPGARFDGFLMNSLSMGLWQGMQIGFIPLAYKSGDDSEEPGTTRHISNFNFKWNFLSYKRWEFALAVSTIKYKSTFETPLVLPGGTYNDVDISYHWTTLVANYYFDHLPLAVGFNISSVSLFSEKKEIDDILQKEITEGEFILDLNYILNSNWALTGSVGNMKESAFELQKAYYGFGGTVTYIRNTKWFNQISVGVHHFNDIKTDKFLFSFSI